MATPAPTWRCEDIQVLIEKSTPTGKGITPFLSLLDDPVLVLPIGSGHSDGHPGGSI